MTLKRGLLVVALVVLSACSGGGEVAAPTTTVDFSLPETSSTTITTSTTTTTVAPETTTTTEAEAVDESGIVLTWAEEGTVEADIERAFWRARPTRDVMYSEDGRDPNYAPFVDTHTGDELERIQAFVGRLNEGDAFNRYLAEPQSRIEFIRQIPDSEDFIVAVCEFTNFERWVEGEVTDGGGVSSEYQASFTLIDGNWRWATLTRLTQDELEEGDAPTCDAESTT